MTVLALLSRSIFGHQNPSNLCIVSYILNRSGIVSNFNNFPNSYLPQLQLNGCSINTDNIYSPQTMIDFLSSGTFYVSHKQSYMRNWNRRLKQHGLRVTLSRKTKWAGNRVMMWVKVRRRTRHPRGVQIPKKRHKN